MSAPELTKYWLHELGAVGFAYGHSCKPTLTGVWRFPAFGSKYRLREEGVFNSEADAKIAARKWIATERAKLDALEAQL